MIENKALPYEVAPPGSFIMFEIKDQIHGYPYISLREFSWKKSGSGIWGPECLEIRFGSNIIQLFGEQLRTLLILLRTQELFLVREGQDKDSNYPKIIKIEKSAKQEEEDSL